MTNKEILESNKLIAKFMDFEFLNKNDYAKQVHCPSEELDHMPDCNCYYHSSWDWLMPVLIKVVSMKEYGEFRKGYMWPYMEGNPMACFSISQKYDINLTLNIIYKEVIEFIKWYSYVLETENLRRNE